MRRQPGIDVAGVQASIADAKAFLRPKENLGQNRILFGNAATDVARPAHENVGCGQFDDELGVLSFRKDGFYAIQQRQQQPLLAALFWGFMAPT